MEDLSSKQLALVSVSLARIVQQLAQQQAGRVGRSAERVRDSVSERVHPRPRHRLRNSLLGIAGCLGLATLVAGLLVRRGGSASSAFGQADSAAERARGNEAAGAR